MVTISTMMVEIVILWSKLASVTKPQFFGRKYTGFQTF